MSKILDAISLASKNVKVLVDRDLTSPPVPVHSEKKQSSLQDAPSEEQNTGFDTGLAKSVVEVYEVWKIQLQHNSEYDYNEVFVVISAKYEQVGYANGTWDDVEYRGFYSSKEEALSEIKGYL